ncbi:MAG: DNA-directed RNA polymerase subunit K [Candidatus Nanoarchaeia archaeon]|nr:DNA-directed RNA polymerase subunit K [Candidatus Nanoarchaeia archaeon]MDD5357644.1 DNA-directed RNA polymerase subunit K [Candidatus Nanoarchaeia archaeon]MDD5588563.1 DNA-directed RNA polymerase subunit K [Candidatus Nanoarchaeia archaeon]
MLEGFSKYETARILGARALQISMNAPLLIKIDKEDLEKINYDAIKIAEVELNSEILPISVKRPFPIKREERLRRVRGNQISEQKIQTRESEEESEIAEGGEIMELATPVDEVDDMEEESSSEQE